MVFNKVLIKNIICIFCLIIFSIIIFLPEPQEKVQNNFDYKKCVPENIEDYEKNQNLIKYSFTHNTLLYYHYISVGRFEDAIKTIDKFEKDNFYPTCYRYQSNNLRFLCKTKMKIFNLFFEPIINTNEYKHTYKANAYYKMDNIEKAKEELSLKTEKSSLTDKINFKIYLEENKFDKAEEIIESSNIYDKKIYLAELYSAKNEYKKAENLYNELLKELPKRDDIKINYAALLINQKNYSKAINILKSAKEDKYFYAVNYNLGVCYKNLGNNKKAKAYFKKVLSKNPDNKNFVEYLVTDELKPYNR